MPRTKHTIIYSTTIINGKKTRSEARPMTQAEERMMEAAVADLDEVARTLDRMARRFERWM